MKYEVRTFFNANRTSKLVLRTLHDEIPSSLFRPRSHPLGF
jgi:hypothetical protein